MKATKAREIDGPFDDGEVYIYDIYCFSEDDKEFPHLVAVSYADTQYEVHFKSIYISEHEIKELSRADLTSPIFLLAIEYLKGEGKKRIGSRFDDAEGYTLLWSAIDGEKPGTDMNKLPYLGPISG
jgi:hypothetical protein